MQGGERFAHGVATSTRELLISVPTSIKQDQALFHNCC